MHRTRAVYAGIVNEPQLRKQLGQHLLKNHKVIDSIIQAGQVHPEDTILEVGPGTGMLTKRLVSIGKRVEAIEYDRRMIDSLRHSFASEVETGKLVLTQGDFAKLPVPAFDVCLANIPYQISSILIGKLLAHPSSFRCAVLMLQHEFAQRLMARPGSSQYSRLSVNVQLSAHVETIMNVPRGDFKPPPKVDSQVVKITPHATPRAQGLDRQRLDTLLRICFHRKKRTLRALLTARTALSQVTLLGSRGDADTAQDVIRNVLVEMQHEERRAIKMSGDEFITLYETLAQAGIQFVPFASKHFQNIVTE